MVERRRVSAPYRHPQAGEGFRGRHGDDHSDRGTYTIELENGDHEEEEARRMIDKVRGTDTGVVGTVHGVVQKRLTVV